MDFQQVKKPLDLGLLTKIEALFFVKFPSCQSIDCGIISDVQVRFFPLNTEDVVQEPQLLIARVGTAFNITSHNHVRCEKSVGLEAASSPALSPFSGLQESTIYQPKVLFWTLDTGLH